MTKFRYILLLAVMCSCVALLRADPTYLAGGGYHFVAVNAGQVVGLGDGTYGQLGPSPDDIPATVAGLTGIKQVAAGGFSTIALKSDGTVWFLGESTLQHTTPHGTPNAIASAVQVPGLSGIDAIVAGHRHFLALDYDGGRLFAWGHNGSGQLGDGSLLDTGSATLVLTGVASMAAGDGFSLAVMSDNTVRSWGRNTHGQLGLGDTADRPIPTLVPGVSNAFAVAAGGQHSLILLTNGTVLATGNNAFGQLGLGTTSSTNTPTAVVTLSGITAIAAGFHHSAAIGPPNQPYLWGRNFEGQCGGGDTSPVSYQSPQILTLDAPVMALACGYHFTIFELTDGTVWGTGSNSDGQLDGSSLAGPDDSQKILIPQEVPVTLDSTLPIVDAGINMITWSNQEVTLDATVINNDPCEPQSPLTYAWSADAVSMADGNLDITITPDVVDPADAKVLITKTDPTGDATVVTMTLAVTLEGKDPVKASMTIDVYDDACKAAIGKGLAADYPADVDKNCIINFNDLAVMAAKWLNDTGLTEPLPK